jgi:2-haloacid dehalogenase
MAARRVVIFDLGNVLIPWDPRFLYRKLLPDEPAVDAFLAKICTAEWNYELDRGRPWDEAVAELLGRFPAHAHLIRAYDTRWEEMLGDPIAGSVALLDELAGAGTPVYALTNWSAAKFTVARRRFPFLGRFRDVVVSGEVRLAKPDPAIYRLLLERNGLAAGECVFIDDSLTNIEAAAGLGIHPIHFQSPDQTREALRRVLG